MVPPGKRLASHGLYVGNPARRLRELTEKEIAQLTYSARHYVHVKDMHLADQALRVRASSTV